MVGKSQYCSVIDCFHTVPKITLHSFPNKESVLYRVWIEVLTKDKNKPFSPSPNYSRICSAHFEESSFKFIHGVKQLTADAIPKFMPWGTVVVSPIPNSSSTDVVGSTAQTKKVPPLICGNCSCSLSKEESSIPQRHVIKYAGVKDENDLDLYVTDAIAYILGISWDNFCKDLQTTNEVVNKIMLDDVTRDGKRVAFCRQCATSLYLNYTAQKNLERLTKPGSIMDQAKQFSKNGINNEVKTEPLAESVSFLCETKEEPVDVNWENDEFVVSRSNDIEVTPCTLKSSPKNSNEKENNSEYYTCVHCCETFISKDGWLAHSINHSEKFVDEKTTICAICGKWCKSAMHYKYLHKPLHQKAKSWKCKTCTKSFHSKSNLNDHLMKVHNQKIKKRVGKKCEICRRFIFARGEKMMEAHIAKHTANGVWFECLICQEKCPTSKQLSQHKKVHKLKEPLFCKICCRPFYYENKLEEHEARHAQQQEFECELCDKKFARRDLLKSHTFNVHVEREAVKCELCGKLYKNEKTLSSHMKLHTDLEEGGVQCDECGKILKHKDSLRSHKLQVHLRITRYMCSICGQKLSGPSMLKFHENLHRTDPNFKGRPRKLKNPKITFIVKPNRTIIKHPKNVTQRGPPLPPAPDEESFFPTKPKYTYNKRKITPAVDNTSQPKEPSSTPESTKPSFKRRFISDIHLNLRAT